MPNNPYTQHYNQIQTHQGVPIPGRTDQVRNNAGGFVFGLTPMQRLERFLILGSEGNTLYQSEREITLENAQAVRELIDSGRGVEVMEKALEVSTQGKAYKNDPALFALAMAIKFGDDATRTRAYDALPEIARTHYHVTTLLEILKSLGKGWSYGLRRAISNVYNRRPLEAAMRSMLKYPNRNGWSQRDVLLKAHVRPDDALRGQVYGIAIDNPAAPYPDSSRVEDPQRREQYENALMFYKGVRDLSLLEEGGDAVSFAAQLIRQLRIPRENVPQWLLSYPEIWDAMLDHMLPIATLRNIATMTRVGLLTPFAAANQKIRGKLLSEDLLQRERVHPIQVLAALATYRSGMGARGQHTWTPVQEIVEILDAAFYKTFDLIEPSNQRVLLALDVSGSMGVGNVSGVPGLTPREAASALAMVTARTEPRQNIVAFASSADARERVRFWSTYHHENKLVPLPITARDSLGDVMQKTRDLPFGGTDCSLPMRYAMENNISVDCFITLSDNETWAGKIHASQALEMYRREMGIDSRFVAVGMTASRYSVADSNDPNSLNLVGFSADTPKILSDFAARRI